MHFTLCSGNNLKTNQQNNLQSYRLILCIGQTSKPPHFGNLFFSEQIIERKYRNHFRTANLKYV